MAVIVIVGLARAGKDTAADYIAEKYGYAKYTFSSVLSEMIEKRGEEATKEKMIMLGDAMREKMGMDAVAKMLARNVKEKDNILLVGPRSPEEIDYFREKFPGLIVIRITAQDSERFGRKSPADPKTEKEFFGRDEKDIISKGFQRALDSAQAEIRNTSTQEMLHAEIDKAMGKMGARGTN